MGYFKSHPTVFLLTVLNVQKLCQCLMARVKIRPYYLSDVRLHDPDLN